MTPEMRAFLKAAMNLGPAHSGSVREPYVYLHPYCERAGYSPSRVWRGHASGFMDSQMSFEAIDAFNESLNVLLRTLPEAERVALIAEVLHVKPENVDAWDEFAW